LILGFEVGWSEIERVSAWFSPLRFCRRICLEATTVEIETLTPRMVSTVATDGLLLMLSEFY